MYSRAVERRAKCRTISSALSVLLAKMSLAYWRRRQMSDGIIVIGSGFAARQLVKNIRKQDAQIR